MLGPANRRVPVRLESVFACRFGVVFHSVVPRKLVVEVRSEQVYPWFEFQEAPRFPKYTWVEHNVIIIAFPF